MVDHHLTSLGTVCPHLSAVVTGQAGAVGELLPTVGAAVHTGHPVVQPADGRAPLAVGPLVPLPSGSERDQVQVHRTAPLVMSARTACCPPFFHSHWPLLMALRRCFFLIFSLPMVFLSWCRWPRPHTGRRAGPLGSIRPQPGTDTCVAWTCSPSDAGAVHRDGWPATGRPIRRVWVVHRARGRTSPRTRTGWPADIRARRAGRCTTASTVYYP